MESWPIRVTVDLIAIPITIAMENKDWPLLIIILYIHIMGKLRFYTVTHNSPKYFERKEKLEGLFPSIYEIFSLEKCQNIKFQVSRGLIFFKL